MCGGPLKCGGPCSAEHVRTLVNPALVAGQASNVVHAGCVVADKIAPTRRTKFFCTADMLV